MADMIRAATPITNKNIVQPLREHHDADIAPFDLQDPSKIVKALPDSELLKQNTGNIEKQTAPEILMDLLKDPSVTVNFIKKYTNAARDRRIDFYAERPCYRRNRTAIFAVGC